MKADTPSNTGKQEGRQWETRGRQDLGKVDAPCSTGHMWGDNGRQLGGQWETMGDTQDVKKRTHHPTQAHISRETMGDNEKQDFGKVDHPTQAHVGRQWEAIGDNGGKWETRGDNRRQG